MGKECKDKREIEDKSRSTFQKVSFLSSSPFTKVVCFLEEANLKFFFSPSKSEEEFDVKVYERW